MLWLVAPSAAVASAALLVAGCAKGRDDAKRPRSRSDKLKKSSRSSSRKPGTSSRSSRSQSRGAGAAKKSSRSKREGGSSKSKSGSKSRSKSGSRSQPMSGPKSGSKSRSKSAVKPLDDPNKAGPLAGGGMGVSMVAAAKSPATSSKRRRSKSIDGSQRSSRSSRSKSRRSASKSKRSSRSKRSSKRSFVKREVLQVDKTQECSIEDANKPLPKTGLTPAVSVTTIDLAAPEAIAKHEVRIEPSELRWAATGGIQNVAVYNHSTVRKALKIKCSDNLLYRVNPVHTFVNAGESVRVDILRQAGAPKVDKIVFIVADAASDAQNARDAVLRTANTDMMVLPLIATPAY